MRTLLLLLAALAPAPAWGAPSGWSVVDERDDRVERERDGARLVVAAVTGVSAVEVLARALGDAATKVVKGWRCGSREAGDATVAVCAREADGRVLVAGLSAPTSAWKDLGGLKLLREAGQEAEALAPTPLADTSACDAAAALARCIDASGLDAPARAAALRSLAGARCEALAEHRAALEELYRCAR